jgi:hypothetical protein
MPLLLLLPGSETLGLLVMGGIVPATNTFSSIRCSLLPVFGR